MPRLVPREWLTVRPSQNGKQNTLVSMISNGDDVSCVCTSGITNMQLFQNNQNFNQDISSWDTSCKQYARIISKCWII